MFQMIPTGKKYNVFIFFFSFAFLFFFISQINTYAGYTNSHEYFNSLEKSLVKEGFNKKTINKIFDSEKVYFETKGIYSYLIHSEARVKYKQYASSKSIQNALKYMDAHKTELARAEKMYGVDKEVITAIILIETRLGKSLGKPLIFNILSTMASLAYPKVRNMLWDRISGATHVTRKEYEKWAEKKSGWAYKELNAFLKYTFREKIDPLTIYGSYAGALGIAQFMPTSILDYAKDGDNNGRIDLFNHADAIASVASYLKHYGWYPGIGKKGAYKAIYHYNHSNQYVDTVLKVSKLLKG